MKRTILLLGFAFLCGASSSKAQSNKEDSINRHKACYTQALQELEAMLQGKATPNFEHAVFLMENAYYANQFSYEAFQNVLDRKEADIRLLKEMQRLVSGEKLKAYKPSIWERAQQTPEQRTKALENLMGNWAIYAYMKDSALLVANDKLRYIVHQKPYRYSRSDPMGTADWRNTQVMNLIANGEGNCFALATLYKIFADRLQTDALLATAPSHIFIRHADEEGRMFNVELSNSSFPGTGTMETLTYTTKEATQNNLAMRNLNPTQSIALCVVYLAKGYEQLFQNNTEPIVMRCADLALQYDSLSLNALLLKSEVLQSRLLAQKKKIAQLKNEGDFKQLEQLTTKLYQLGYREMPLEMKNFLIQRWTQDSSTILIKHNYAYQAPNGSGVAPTRYASLSWGMFDEEIPHKAVEHYGRFLYDTKAQRLSAIAPEQELYNHYNFDPVAFAMNVDPLAHKLPSWSPYVFCKDNPILNFDPDGAFPYTIHVRSFAPYSVFGGGFAGDSRGYSTGAGKRFEGGTVTSRIQQKFTVDPSTSTQIKTTSWSDESSHPIFGTGTGNPKSKISDISSSKDQDGNNTISFTAHLAGNVPLIPSADIDIHTNFTLTENTRTGTLNVTAIQTGDQFPSAETFIGDSKGNQLFIGVSPAVGFDDLQSLGPYEKLPGNNNRPMMKSSFSISIDKNGVFTGVTQGDKTYTTSEWNSMMQSQPTTQQQEKPLPVR